MVYSQIVTSEDLRAHSAPAESGKIQLAENYRRDFLVPVKGTCNEVQKRNTSLKSKDTIPVLGRSSCAIFIETAPHHTVKAFKLEWPTARRQAIGWQSERLPTQELKLWMKKLKRSKSLTRLVEYVQVNFIRVLEHYNLSKTRREDPVVAPFPPWLVIQLQCWPNPRERSNLLPETNKLLSEWSCTVLWNGILYSRIMFPMNH